MANQRVPKAIRGNLFLPKASTWNIVAAICEWISKLAVAPPLMLSDSASGPVLSIALEDGTAVLVKITTIAGGAKYNGRIVTGDPDPTASTAADLSMPEGMTVPSADNCIVYNTLESTTHRVVLNHYYVGEIRGNLTDGTPIVFVNLNGDNVTAVSLTTDGGINGSNTPPTTATYTYTVKTPDGATTLGTGVSPDGNREQGKLTGPATIGMIRYAAADGALHLIQCDERASIVACP